MKKILFLFLLLLFAQILFAESRYSVISNSQEISNYLIKDYDDGGVFEITNTGSLNVSSCSFVNNKASVGGAILNKGFLEINNPIISEEYEDDITPYFSNNISFAGGAIYNEGIMNTGEWIYFCNNSSSTASVSAGGAIYSRGITNIGSWNYFEQNTSNLGGAIFVSSGITNISNMGAFTQNSADFGGAIVASSGTTNIADFVFFTSNTATSSGGAIFVDKNAKVVISSANYFTWNKANTGTGGAIHNTGIISIGVGQETSVTSFVENSAKSGGAICNNNFLGLADVGLFGNNKADFAGGAVCNIEDGLILFDKIHDFISNSSSFVGGAIFNSSGTVILGDGANFVNNKADEFGGGIYNEEKGEILLVAKTKDILFEGNTANGVSNAIYDDGGEIYLNASSKASVIFNDRIVSKDDTSILNINKTFPEIKIDGYIISFDIPTTGTIFLNEDMTGYTGTVNLYGGTLRLGMRGTLFGGNYNIKNYAVIDMENNTIQEHNFNKLTADYRFDLCVDADLSKKQMDTISAESYSGPTIHVKAIHVVNDTEETKTKVLFTSSTVLKDKIATIDTVSSKLYEYQVSYNNGYFNFINLSKLNPVIVESAIAGSVGGFTTQTNVLGQAFSSIDAQISNRKSAKKQGVLYASTSSSIFDMENKIERGLWIRPYAVQETVKFNDIDVDNTAIGTLAGLDLAAGENTLLSFYLGYAGSNQKYESIKVSQTGYILGATGMIIKEKWYAGLTANINFNKAQSQSDYGTDNFDMNMYSIGAKAGYNFDLSDKWILEPNLMLMYGNVNSQEYETTQGAKIDSQSTANIIVEPQVKAKLSLDNGWQPYGLLGYVANISDKAKVVVDGTEFETDKIDGYVEYGAGVNKDFINTPWSCYLEAKGRSGGRTGFAGNLGIKYKF